MVILILRVNGKVYTSERKTLKQAKELAGVWLAEAKKSYPNKEFTPQFYQGKRVS